MIKKQRVGITGSVRVKVYDENMNVKRYPQTWLDQLFGHPGKPMVMENHNIVTNEGDALIADIMQETPERTKVNNASGLISVGTGFATELKTTDALVTPTGSAEAMDATYPVTEGDWAGANDNVIVYKATFEAGDLNDTGIDEALLGTVTDTLAYAQITPAVNVSTSDTLEVTWKITFLGA